MGIKNTKTYKRGFKDGWEQAKRECMEIASREGSIACGCCDDIERAIAAMEYSHKEG